MAPVASVSSSQSSLFLGSHGISSSEAALQPCWLPVPYPSSQLSVVTMTQLQQPNGIASGSATDPLSTQSAYDLRVNSLSDLVAFEHTSAGLCVVSRVSRPAGAHLAYISSHAPQPLPTWKTIQTSATTHTDPQSALLYMNHSCAPSVEVHVFSPDADGRYPSTPPQQQQQQQQQQQEGRSKDDTQAVHTDSAPRGLAGQVTVSRHRALSPGDPLTFFYPSTEWQFDRSFTCLCGAGEGTCLGEVKGAAALSRNDLTRWFVNRHIWEMAEKRDAE